MARGANWIHDGMFVSREKHKVAKRLVVKNNETEAQKKYERVLVCEHPRTYKLVEIKEIQ